MRALEFGPFEELMNRYGNLRRIKDMPRDSITKPAVVFKPADSKREIVPWDSKRALELWRKRESYEDEPLLDMSEVTRAPGEIVGRNKLVLKAKESAELMYYTTDDE
jgi:anaerobic dimethyl sulfoxide reductase subunit B (iron-sulfur subunit)